MNILFNEVGLAFFHHQQAALAVEWLDEFVALLAAAAAPVAADTSSTGVSPDIRSRDGARTRDRAFNNENRILFQVATTFPWKKD